MDWRNRYRKSTRERKRRKLIVIPKGVAERMRKAVWFGLGKVEDRVSQ